jgi:hypothetical protein
VRWRVVSGVAGRVALHFFGSMAEFERDIIRERTNAGLAAPPRLTLTFTKQALSELDHGSPWWEPLAMVSRQHIVSSDDH